MKTIKLALGVAWLLSGGCQIVLGIEDTPVTEHEAIHSNDAGGDDEQDGEQDAGGDADGSDADDSDAEDTDAGEADAGEADAGATDAGATDAGATDAGALLPEPPADRVFGVVHPWPTNVLFVCFELSRAPEEGAAYVEQALFAQRTRERMNATWGRLTGLAFAFYGACPTNALMLLKVQISDTADSQSGLGFPGGAGVRTLILKTNDHEARVLYTIGRALGFEHEYGLAQAEDRECTRCDESMPCSGAGLECLPSGFCGRRREHESIMQAPDRCGGVESLRSLSRWDVMGAQRAYGYRYPGAVVDVSGNCFDMAGGAPEPGGQLGTWPCFGAEHERFVRSFTAEDGRAPFVTTIQDRELCVAAAMTPGIAPTHVVSAECDPRQSRQQVVFHGVQVRAVGDTCMAAQAVEAEARLIIADCMPGAPTQRWDVLGRQLQLSGSELCATIPGGAAVAGAVPRLKPCVADDPAQSFELRDGEIRYVDAQHGTLCFNVLGGWPIPGSEVGLWTGCHVGFENMIFHLAGPITLAGQCVGLLGEPGAGTRVDVETCEPDAADQFWEYYY